MRREEATAEMAFASYLDRVQTNLVRFIEKKKFPGEIMRFCSGTLSAPSKHLSVISGPHDEILHQQFKSGLDFYFFFGQLFSFFYAHSSVQLHQHESEAALSHEMVGKILDACKDL